MIATIQKENGNYIARYERQFQHSAETVWTMLGIMRHSKFLHNS